MTKDELARSSKSRSSKRKKRTQRDDEDVDDDSMDDSGGSGSAPNVVAGAEEGDDGGWMLPDGVVPGVAFWIVVNCHSNMVDEFATTVKTMFLDAGFTFCDCSVSGSFDTILHLLNHSVCHFFVFKEPEQV